MSSIRTSAWIVGFCVLACMLPATVAGQDAKNIHWPQFRGPGASGIADGYPIPLRWNVVTGEGVKWKTPIPGLGHSSPIIWGDRLFITTSISGKADPQLRLGLYGNIQPVEDDTVHEWRIYCLDKKTGKILWDKLAVKSVPRVKRHTKATHANSTPATDGKHVVTFFGSEGLFCYDMDGNLLWKKDLGPLDSGYYVSPDAQWAFGSSPIIYQNMVIVQCDVQKNSFLAAFNIKDGSEVWRTARDEVPTWSTPTVFTAGGRTQLVTNGYKHIGGYDIMTGKEIWKLKGGGDIPVPTPVVGRDLVFITNAHGGLAPTYVIRPGATGDITPADGGKSPYIAWSRPKQGCYMQTPIVYQNVLYQCQDNGVVLNYEAVSGRLRYRERLTQKRTGFTASPVAADGKILFTSEIGDVYIIRAGPDYFPLMINSLGDDCLATPAISEGVIFFRTKSYILAVGA